LINDILGDVKDSVDKCKEVSLEALKPINHVLEVVDELVHASSGTKNVNEKAKLEIQKLIEQMEEAKLAKEEETRRLNQEQNEVKQRLDQAKNAYIVGLIELAREVGFLESPSKRCTTGASYNNTMVLVLYTNSYG
jgi:type I site-specific restriction-modification system R (restriction) subunit